MSINKPKTLTFAVIHKKSEVLAMNLLIELHYLPLLPYFSLLKRAEKIYIDLHEPYPRQTLRNRTYVLTAQGVQCLSIPIQKATTQTCTKDVKIDYSQKWVQGHWRTLEAAYNNSPFFEYLADYFRGTYEAKPAFLVDLNIALLTTCLTILRWQKDIIFSQNPIQESIISTSQDHRNHLNPSLLAEQNSQKDIKPYKQVFGKSFVPNMSIIDALSCQGIDSTLFF